jgi:hypothetical protein
VGNVPLCSVTRPSRYTGREISMAVKLSPNREDRNGSFPYISIGCCFKRASIATVHGYVLGGTYVAYISAPPPRLLRAYFLYRLQLGSSDLNRSVWGQCVGACEARPRRHLTEVRTTYTAASRVFFDLTKPSLMRSSSGGFIHLGQVLRSAASIQVLGKAKQTEFSMAECT